jgi:propanediol dehydratase small subunit
MSIPSQHFIGQPKGAFAPAKNLSAKKMALPIQSTAYSTIKGQKLRICPKAIRQHVDIKRSAARRLLTGEMP